MRPDELKTSGLDEMKFRERASRVKVERGQSLREACAHVSTSVRDALVAVRERVGQDALPLLSLLQATPLRLHKAQHCSAL